MSNPVADATAPDAPAQARSPSLTLYGPQHSGSSGAAQPDIDQILDDVTAAVAQQMPTASQEQLIDAIRKETEQKLNMDTIKDRITNPTQARAFANATRNTPRLLALIKQGVYAPTAFAGTTGGGIPERPGWRQRCVFLRRCARVRGHAAHA